MTDPRLILGDCLDAMRAMEPCSVDAIVCDPPYGLKFMGKEWDAPWRSGNVVADPSAVGGFQDGSGGNAYSRSRIRLGRGSGGESQAFQSWCESWAVEALRVLKPGGHLLAFGGTRTFHRLASGLEDAGFEIRDCLAWMYGSGFPKSLDVARAIDGKEGVEGEWREEDHPGRSGARGPSEQALTGGVKVGQLNHRSDENPEGTRHVYEPATESAREWNGWGTALKPAFEPIVVARKPLIGTVASNVLEHGTGALNIDGCRVAFASDEDEDEDESKSKNAHADFGTAPGGNEVYGDYSMVERTNYDPPGRWPANVILDEQAADLLDAQTGESASRIGNPRGSASGEGWGMTATGAEYDDIGGASRFFYCAKTSRTERGAGLDGFDEGLAHDDVRLNSSDEKSNTRSAQRNIHPTVKPVRLMRWLIRLVTPPGGTVLDPFTGSGTTGIAAVLEHMDFVGVERDPDYMRIAEARIAYWAEHGEAALEDHADRESSARSRQAVADAGQLDIFTDPVTPA